MNILSPKMADVSRAGVFLATTALEDFWDVSYPIVFLSEGCKRYSRRAYWESFKSETPGFGADDDKTFEIVAYLKQVHERLLPVLAERLNAAHGTDLPIRSWRIVIGPWLMYYLHILHDKYHGILRVKERYPEFTTICLDASCFVTPQNTFEFIGHMKGDQYNLQICSKILRALNYKFPEKKVEVGIGAERSSALSSALRRVRKVLEGRLASLGRISRNGDKVFFIGAYFSVSAAIRLFLKTGGGFWPLSCGFETPEAACIDHGLRDKIGGVKFGNTEFERILMPLIAGDLPRSFVESFGNIRERVKKEFVPAPKALLSAISWHLNDVFKVYAAEAAEHGTVLLGLQHGGNYGSLKYLFQEDYELGIVDNYYSWGWSKSGCRSEVKPMPASKFSYKMRKSGDKQAHGILYVTTTWLRWLLQYPLTMDYWSDYFHGQKLFLSNIPQAVREHLVIRPHIEDFGWDSVSRFADLVPDARIEGWEVPFSKRMLKCRILVCDHPCYSTTFIEALVNNKPTMLFYNPKFAANRFNEEAKPYWDKLKEADILFDDPILASKKIGEIYDNVDAWWGDKKRQDAVRSFLSHFGRASADWADEWSAEINRVLKK